MKSEKRFWVIVALVFVAILVWHITSAIVPSLAAGIAALKPFLLAFITAYLLRHPVIWMEKLFWLISKKKTHKWQHSAASIVVLALFLGLIAFLVASVLPGLLNNIYDLIEKLPNFINEIVVFVQTTVKDLSDRLDEDAAQRIMQAAENIGYKAVDFISGKAYAVVTTITDMLSGAASFFVDSILYLVATFMLLLSYDHIKQSLKRCIRLFVNGAEGYDEACAFLHDCDTIIEKYVVVRLTTSLGIGIVSYIGFLIFGLPYSVLLALIIALTNLIPYIGPFVGAVPVLLVALTAHEMNTVIGVAIFMFVVQQLEGNVLTPWITSDALDVSAILVLVGIAVFGAMMGIPGMILGAPIVAIISGVVKRAVYIAEKKAELKEKNDETE